MTTRERFEHFTLEEPGDWLRTRDLDRDADSYWLRLWCGHDGQLTDHTVAVDGDKLTVTPSIVCPVQPPHENSHGFLVAGEWKAVG